MILTRRALDGRIAAFNELRGVTQCNILHLDREEVASRVSERGHVDMMRVARPGARSDLAVQPMSAIP